MILGIGVIVVFLIIIIWAISSNDKDEILKETYMKNNNIPTNANNIAYYELNKQQFQKNYFMGSHGELISGKNSYLWRDTNSIIICNAITLINIKNDYKNIVEKTIIPIANIKFYTRDGEYRVDNIVEGGGVSITGAIVGGVIAGGVGTVLAGRKKTTTTQKEVDNRRTYLYYVEDNQDKRIVFTSKSYDILLELIPNKDFGFIEKNKILESSTPKENNSIYNDIEQLANLKDKGILTQEEFNEKKIALLEKI